MRFRLLAFVPALLLAIPGCSLITVDATSGADALPVELRSSSDARRPSVGVPDVPSTQPVGGIVGVTRGVTEGTAGVYRNVFEFATAGSFRQAALDLRSDDFDVRREALVRLPRSSYGRGLPYTDVYRTTAQVDSDGLVRATAVRAINRSRDVDSGPVLVQALADGHPQVRLEAAKALVNLPAPAAEAPLRALAQSNEQDADARIAALDALRHYPTIETRRALIGQLNSSNFALAWQARRSLYLQTNVDHRYDEAAWLNYLAGQ